MTNLKEAHDFERKQLIKLDQAELAEMHPENCKCADCQETEKTLKAFLLEEKRKNYPKSLGKSHTGSLTGYLNGMEEK